MRAGPPPAPLSYLGATGAAPAASGPTQRSNSDYRGRSAGSSIPRNRLTRPLHRSSRALATPMRGAGLLRRGLTAITCGRGSFCGGASRGAARSFRMDGAAFHAAGDRDELTGDVAGQLV